MRYNDKLTVREARARFFDDNGFTLEDYDANWVFFMFGPLPVLFPNVAARKKAVPLHDLHHIATGYGTDVTGEAELAAWELSAGCAPNRAALFLNFLAATAGLLFAPRRTIRAWRKGKAGRTLYEGGFHNALLDMTVGDLRAQIGGM